MLILQANFGLDLASMFAVLVLLAITGVILSFILRQIELTGSASGAAATSSDARALVGPPAHPRKWPGSLGHHALSPSPCRRPTSTAYARLVFLRLPAARRISRFTSNTFSL